MSYWGASYNEMLLTEIVIAIILIITFVGIIYIQWHADNTYNKEIDRFNIEHDRRNR